MSVPVKHGRFCKSSENFAPNHAKYFAEYNNVVLELLK